MTECHPGAHRPHYDGSGNQTSSQGHRSLSNSSRVAQCSLKGAVKKNIFPPTGHPEEILLMAASPCSSRRSVDRLEKVSTFYDMVPVVGRAHADRWSSLKLQDLRAEAISDDNFS